MADEMERLKAIMKRLRSESGCPWDREQTHDSLKPYAIEETYEVIEAIDSGHMDKLREELGDLLLQVVFHAQIAAEEHEFDLEDVAGTIADKLVRRHPHVFAGTEVDGVEGVLSNWERIKGHEYGEERTTALSGVPPGLPALMHAQKLQTKAAHVGFDWPDVRGALAKCTEEWGEFREALDAAGSGSDESAHAHVREEFGDLLFALVNVARFLGIDSEDALRSTLDKFCRRFAYIEETAASRGRKLSEMTLPEMDELWEEKKRME